MGNSGRYFANKLTKNVGDGARGLTNACVVAGRRFIVRTVPARRHAPCRGGPASIAGTIGPVGGRRCRWSPAGGIVDRRELMQKPVESKTMPSDLDLYEMANLYPKNTNLPMTIWVSPKGNNRHDIRIKVNMAHGSSMDISNTAEVAIRPSPRIVSGHLSSDDRDKVFKWIALNRIALIHYWDGSIDTIDLGQLIQKISP